MGWSKGLTKETDSRVARMSKALSGSGHPNWKGGISRDIEYCRQRDYLIKKKWRERNRDKVRLYSKRRKAQLRASGKLSIATVQQVYEDNIKEYGTLTCYLCGKKTPFGKDRLEHKIPVSRGGTNRRENLGVACEECNLRKWTKTVEEYMSKYIAELIKHPGWDELRRRVLEGMPELGIISWRQDLDKRLRVALRLGKYDEARYYQGQIETIELLFDSGLIDRWISEIKG